MLMAGSPEAKGHGVGHRHGGGPGAILLHDSVVGVVATQVVHTATTIRQLGDLSPTTLAIMHGKSFRGDGKAALYDLASGYETLIAGG